MEQLPTMPPPPTEERCYRHPGVVTGVHCTRCSRPICPDCMVPAPVGHQCPECVAEARREFRKGPGRRIAVAQAKGVSVTSALLALIGAAYIVEIAAGGAGSLFTGPNGRSLVRLGASVAAFPTVDGGVIGVAAGQYWRLFTAMFLHAGVIHIAFNAYALYIFGSVMEQELGRIRFLAIYLITGLVAGSASYAFGPNAIGVGASGAIFGVFGAFVAYNYRRRASALAAARLRSAFGLLLINTLLAFAIRGIDWRAHVGGFVAGLVAGFAADSMGGRSTRRVIAVAGFAALIVAGVGLVVWRTAQIRSDFPGLF